MYMYVCIPARTPPLRRLLVSVVHVNTCMYICQPRAYTCAYIYVYIYTHTHTRNLHLHTVYKSIIYKTALAPSTCVSNKSNYTYIYIYTHTQAASLYIHIHFHKVHACTSALSKAALAPATSLSARAALHASMASKPSVRCLSPSNFCCVKRRVHGSKNVV
jgi:hypothetical protein